MKDAQKLPAIIQKIETLREQELEYLELAKRRQEYLERVLESENTEEYMRLKYYRLLAEYLARRGEFEIARQVAKTFSIQVLLFVF